MSATHYLFHVLESTDDGPSAVEDVALRCGAGPSVLLGVHGLDSLDTDPLLEEAARHLSGQPFVALSADPDDPWQEILVPAASLTRADLLEWVKVWLRAQGDPTPELHPAGLDAFQDLRPVRLLCGTLTDEDLLVIAADLLDAPAMPE